MIRKPISKNIRQKVFDMYDGHCAYCGEEISLRKMQVDHIIPIIKGGTNDISNLRPSCRMCNFYKSTMHDERFRQQLGELTRMLKEREYIYRLALKYGIVEENDEPITFYFENNKERL